MSRIDTQADADVHITQSTQKTSKRKAVIGACCGGVVVVGLLAYSLLGTKADDAKTFNQVITPDNIQEILSQINDSDKTAPDNYEVYMNTTWTFPDANTPSIDAIVGNQKTNTQTVYFTIALKETSQQVYKSPYIPVGSSLQNIVLDEKLGAGTYPAVITYHLVDDDYNELSSVAINMTLVIQN
jgi:hypothetical protein